MDDVDEDVDEELDAGAIKDRKKNVNDTMLNIPDILLICIKKNSQPSQYASMIQQLVTLVQTNLKSQDDTDDIRLGIYLVDDLVEELPFESVAEYWDLFYQVLLEFTINERAEIRNSAAYGLGRFI